MKKSVWAVLVVLFFSSKFIFQTAHGSEVKFVPGEVIVKFKSGMAQKFLEQNSNDFQVKRNLNLIAGEFAVLRTGNKSDLKSITNFLNNDPNIEYAEPNYIYQAIDRFNQHDSISDLIRNGLDKTNDPRYGELWGLYNNGNNEPASDRGNSSASGKAGSDINAINAWAITKGSKNIKIAVIDTGVDYNHPDLKSNIWTNTAEANGQAGVDDDGNGFVDDIHGYDFANKDGDPLDGNGHGTHCAGTIAAEHNNGIGIAGVMAEAQIIGVKFLTDQGSGSTADAIAAIDYATKINVDLMSNSWGGGGFSQALEDVISAANDKGIIFTAAAGNSASDNNTTPHYPSNYDLPNVISVAAHNYNDGLASFSCYGSNTVHVAAPGRNILSTTPNNSYAVYSGTSMATPHVSGVVGLYLAYRGSTDPETLRNALMSSSIYSAAYGRKTISGGRVDAYNFLTGVTATRPAKPDPNAWGSMQVDLFATPHPYPNKTTLTKTYNVPGAKFLRLVISKHDIENNYDFISIKDAQGTEVQRIDGVGVDVKSDYVDGESMTVEFVSDTSVNKWGFEIQEIEYIQ